MRAHLAPAPAALRTALCIPRTVPAPRACRSRTPLRAVVPFALLLALLASHAPAALADTIVTVDDTDTSSILYSPLSSWVESSFDQHDAGGTHMSTQDPEATATFSFTGTAIYFWAPLWPALVTTALALDGGAPVLVNLRDPTQPLNVHAGESATSAVVWSVTGLADELHTLVVSVGDGENLAIVDQLQYTISDTDPLPSSSSATTSTSDPDTSTSDPDTSTSDPASSTASTSSFLPTPTKSSASSASGSGTSGLPIAIGIVVGLFALLGLAVFAWWWRRRRARRAEEWEGMRRADGMREVAGGVGSGGGLNGDGGAGAGTGVGPAVLGRTRSARYRDIAAHYFNADGDGRHGNAHHSNARPSRSRINGGAPAAAGTGTRQRRPPPPVPRRKPPPAIVGKRHALGTIPEVHPREVLVEDEEAEVRSGAGGRGTVGDSSNGNSRGTMGASVRLVGAGGNGRPPVDDRDDPWAVRAS